MSIECPECGERVAALPIHKCRKGNENDKLIDALIEFHDWHMDICREKTTAKYKKVDYRKYAIVLNSAVYMLHRQDEVIAERDKTIASLKAQLSDGAQPFTDPNRENKHSR